MPNKSSKSPGKKRNKARYGDFSTPDEFGFLKKPKITYGKKGKENQEGLEPATPRKTERFEGMGETAAPLSQASESPILPSPSELLTPHRRRKRSPSPDTPSPMADEAAEDSPGAEYLTSPLSARKRQRYRPQDPIEPPSPTPSRVENNYHYKYYSCSFTHPPPSFNQAPHVHPPTSNTCDPASQPAFWTSDLHFPADPISNLKPSTHRPEHAHGSRRTSSSQTLPPPPPPQIKGLSSSRSTRLSQASTSFPRNLATPLSPAVQRRRSTTTQQPLRKPSTLFGVINNDVSHRVASMPLMSFSSVFDPSPTSDRCSTLASPRNDDGLHPSFSNLAADHDPFTRRPLNEEPRQERYEPHGSRALGYHDTDIWLDEDDKGASG